MMIDFKMYLNCPDMLDTVVTNFCDFVQETLGEEMEIYNDAPSEKNESIDMDCSLYPVNVTSIEWDPASLEMGEYYNIDFTVEFTFWMYTSVDDLLKDGHVIQLFLVLSRLYPGDALLLEMGDDVVYRKNEAGLYVDDGKGDNGDYYVKLLEQEWKRKRDGVSLPFQLRILAFPSGEDCLSIAFDPGYELLTVFLVFEAVNAYPAIYKALTAVLNQRSSYKEIGLNVCSLEIHPDTTKIMDDLARDGKERCCELATKELRLLIQIWADERDMRLRRISREELKAEVNKVCEPGMPTIKKDEESKWKFFRKKSRKTKDEKETQESEEQEKEKQKSVVTHRKSEVYAVEAGIVGMPERVDGNYLTGFPEEMTRQEIADTIREAYGNKVRIIENAYMGRVENRMKIALFLSDAGKILSAFPLC